MSSAKIIEYWVGRWLGYFGDPLTFFLQGKCGLVCEVSLRYAQYMWH